MCSSIVKSLSCINRVFNILYAIIGAALCKYGVGMLIKDKFVLHALSCTFVVVGALVTLMCVFYACCGHRSRLFGCTYAMFMFTIFLGNAAILGYSFENEDTVIRYLNSTLVDVPSSWVDDKKHAQFALHITEISIGGLSISFLLAAPIAMCQRASLNAKEVSYDRIYDDGYGDEEYSYDYVPPSVANRNANSEVECGRNVNSRVAERFREKYSDLYDKYGIQSG